MASTNPSAAQLTLSGRELALNRRQAMAVHGKAAVAVRARPASTAPLVAGARSPAQAVSMNQPMASFPTMAPASAAKQRRQALSQAGKAALPRLAEHRTRDAAVAQVRQASQSSGGCSCSGGSASDAQGSLGAASASLRMPAANMHSSDFDLVRAARAAQPAGGRQAAMQRRQARTSTGCGPVASTAPARPSGRLRPRPADLPVPPKVGQGHTLAGRPVTGTLVDSTRKLTGTEPGKCRPITGTEYLGLEPFESLCGTRPAAGPAKVGESRTLRDQKVTGTEIGRAQGVTGDEPGACRHVTGTEYLGREQFASICGTEPPTPSPRKVSVMSTRGGQTVSGAPMERTAKVTGDERGATRTLTGAPFQSRSSVPSDAPPKVGEVETRAGTAVTGTEVGPSRRMTGDDRGNCHAVTGSDYLSPRQQQAVCETPTSIAPIAKVGQDQTFRGQTVTGTQVGRGERVTGDEPGGCAPISGTPYIGRGQFQGYCAPPQIERQIAQLPSRTVISATSVSGDRPGAGGSKMTGDGRGACGPVSGTPYVGRDNAPAYCPPTSAPTHAPSSASMNPRFVPRERPVVQEPSAPAPTDFSIRPPSRQAQDRQAEQAVTGTAFNSQRITGPINKASGLITGTPEFRHAEAAPAAPTAAATTDVAGSAATRLTGEGSQAGIRVSGDAWQGRGRVTGTEGNSSLARNPSQRGQPQGIGMGMGMTAMRMRDEVERVELPPSPVTGSSGNTLRGASITVSGGARA
jgi:hypothetical protein